MARHVVVQHCTAAPPLHRSRWLRALGMSCSIAHRAALPFPLVQALRELEAQRERLEQQRQERERIAAEALRQVVEREQRQRAAHEQAQQDERQARERRRAVLEATLPLEPEPLGSSVVTAVFRLPDGARVSRRFPLDSPTSLLFHFCDAKGAGGLEPESYRLVMQYPRRVVEPGFVGTLEQAGLVAGQQEALMLEPLTVANVAGTAGGSSEGAASAAAASGQGQA